MTSRKPSRPDAIRAVVPRPGEGKRGEDGYLAYLLRQAAGAVRLRLERALEAYGVTPAQFAVLTMLQAYPGASGADIARLTLLTPQTVHGITGNLERVGLVKRIAHPVHGRVQQLELTEQGQALLAKCRGTARELDRALAGLLTAEEERVVRRWLVALAAAAGKEIADPQTTSACATKQNRKRGDLPLQQIARPVPQV